ncbi:Ionotropic receptor 75a [Pseudolycoriella hygida]|uniref:Ionotropic receptor 75a n=1 Tax=Pseudolycoriella hygida TaxID=35572 RepID=A0A9Q0NB74_9DIPT|nr:Ionotropic receptor 75a [Pseudolycoriella hygida]
MKLHVALVLFGSITICICSQSTSLVKDYLTYNNLNTVLLIPCRNEPTVDSIRNLRTLQEYGGWTNVRDIADESLTTDSDKFFVRLSNAHCVVVSLDCNETIEFLSKASDRKLFHYERNWLIFGSNLSRSYDILREQNINVDAEVTLAIPLESDRSYELYEVYNPSSKHGGRLNVTRCGQWSESTGFHITFKQTKTQRRQNFNGITFPAVVTLRKVPKDITFMEHLRSNDLGYVNNVSRFGYHIFSLIMDIHNFKIHIHVANIFAYFDSSGWHGAIDAVNRSEVEFCLTPLRWENDRYGLLEQTIHIYHVRVLFIFRHPKSVPSNAFLLPFKSTLWYAIIGLSLLSACIVRNIFSVENHKKVTNSTKVVSTNEDSFSNSLLMVFGFIVQQGYFGNLLLTSSRILAIAVLTFSLLIYQFYSSFIVGSLLIESPKNIKTMKQLINSELTLGMDEVPYVENIYSYSKGESTEESYKRIMSNQKKSIMSTRAGLDLLKKGTHSPRIHN